MFQTGAQVTDKAIDGILQRLDALAAKIGTTAAQLWQVYIAEARVETIRDFLLAGTLFGITGVAGFAAYKLIRTGIKNDRRGDGFGYFFGGGVCCIAAIVLFVIALSTAYGAIPEALNPQYWAFQHLTQDIKGLL